MKHLSVSFCLLFMPLPSFAAFTLIENFDSYATGGLNGQGGWNTNGQWTVAAAPAGGSGNVGSGAAATGNGGAFKALNTAIADVNTASTLFFRVYRTGGVNVSAGLSDEAIPITLFTGYEVQLNAQHNTATTDTFKIRDAGNFDDLGTGSWAVNTWYNIWMVINNSTNTFEVYMNQGDFGTAGTLQLHIADPAPITPGDFTFGFRNGAATNPLTTLAFAMGGSTPALPGAFIVDDVYIDTGGQNLVNPVPEPGSAAILGAAAMFGLGVRRRKQRA
jgi:hypothetical protein